MLCGLHAGSHDRHFFSPLLASFTRLGLPPWPGPVTPVKMTRGRRTQSGSLLEPLSQETAQTLCAVTLRNVLGSMAREGALQLASLPTFPPSKTCT